MIKGDEKVEQTQSFMVTPKLTGMLSLLNLISRVKCLFNLHLIPSQFQLQFTHVQQGKSFFSVFLSPHRGQRGSVIEQLLWSRYGLLGYYLAPGHLNKLDVCSHGVLKQGLPVEGWCPCLHQPAAYVMGSTDREGSGMLTLSCLWDHS